MPVIAHYCFLFGQKCDQRHISICWERKSPHSVLTMSDFINAREAHRQKSFIQMDYEVQGNSFIGTKTKQRALFLLILEKNSHSLCWVTRRTSLASRSWKNCNDFLKNDEWWHGLVPAHPPLESWKNTDLKGILKTEVEHVFSTLQKWWKQDEGTKVKKFRDET